MSAVRLSKIFTKTRKQYPSDETSKNAQLLIQAGYIHKELAGVYAYLPLGLKVLGNISQIVREEMNAVGGQELQMTVLQPKEIWEKTDRWDDEKVDNWFKTKLISGAELGVGLTHEEPIIDALKDYVQSYKDLPISVYQIQTKFRNELRAKSGLLRGREFLMKDLYTFARDQEEHERLYEELAEAYEKVYSRLGIGKITYRTFASGGIFSKFSDEFQTLSNVGEDTIYIDEKKRIGVNEEVLTDEILSELGINKSDLVEKKAVEVGNIFSLGSKYSDALDLKFTDEQGQKRSVIMGCYGIGVSRLMGLLAEHFADNRGLVWPENVAPAKVYLASLGVEKEIVSTADNLYKKLQESGVEVLYDDRHVSAGEKFADADLMGIPYRVIVSAKAIEKGGYELKKRTDDISTVLSESELMDKVAR